MMVQRVRIALVAEFGIIPQNTVAAWEVLGLALSGPLDPTNTSNGFEKAIDGIIIDNSWSDDRRVELEQIFHTLRIPFTCGTFLTGRRAGSLVELPHDSREIGFIVWKIFNQTLGAYH